MSTKKLFDRAQQLFPHWSREMQMKWVKARSKLGEPRVKISSAISYRDCDWKFARSL